MKEEGREGERRVKGREGRVGEVEEHVKGSRLLNPGILGLY